MGKDEGHWDLKKEKKSSRGSRRMQDIGKEEVGTTGWSKCSGVKMVRIW